ncbi:MAG TPA: laccase domain-containing protein, partial [Anaerolineae bacterium]|nr:laccase domain-containing protein [Anaerolineae bacterium]
MSILPVPTFNDIPGITAAISLVDSSQPADFSMLPTGPADEPTALTNRNAFAKQLGFDPAKLAIPQNFHSATVLRVEDDYTAQPGDAVVTDIPGWLLGVTVADCVPILIADPNNHAVAAIHS